VRPFVPEAPTLSAASLKPGERGVLKTVLKGTQPTDIPVEVVSVVPQKGEVENVILIRFLPNANERAGRLAQGMSGSPVYVRGKLIGAVGSGWEFGDHRLALVTSCAPSSPTGRGRSRRERHRRVEPDWRPPCRFPASPRGRPGGLAVPWGRRSRKRRVPPEGP